jgi:hypothetical protein
VVPLFALAIWEDAQSKDIERLLRGSFPGCLGGLFSDLQLFGMNGVNNESLMITGVEEDRVRLGPKMGPGNKSPAPSL